MSNEPDPTPIAVRWKKVNTTDDLTPNKEVRLSLRDVMGFLAAIVVAAGWITYRDAQNGAERKSNQTAIKANQETLVEVLETQKAQTENLSVNTRALAVVSSKLESTLGKVTPADVLMELRDIKILDEHDVRRIVAEELNKRKNN